MERKYLISDLLMQLELEKSLMISKLCLFFFCTGIKFCLVTYSFVTVYNRTYLFSFVFFLKAFIKILFQSLQYIVKFQFDRILTQSSLSYR